MATALYKKEILKQLKTASLQAKPDALTALVNHANTKFGIEYDAGKEEELKKALSSILAKIKESGLQSSVITGDQVGSAISSLNTNDADMMNRNVIDVIPAFDMPRFHYDSVRKTFTEVQSQRSKFGSADDKASMLRARYDLLLQRLQRLPAFQPAIQGAASSSKMIDVDQAENEPTEIVTIESLVGQVGKKCIFGQLCQLTEGVYSLEDIHSHITLNLNSPNLMLSSGLFTEGCLVLVEGETGDDGAFHASTLISPPAEPREKSLSVFPQLDWLECDLSDKNNNPEQALKAALLSSPQHAEDMIVMLSDVHLDKPKVLEKLSVMLAGLSGSSVPVAFVFMGNFTSRPYASQPGETARFKACFDALADVLAKFPQICRESHFVFIPGPGDLPLSMGSAIPSNALPAAFTGKLKEKLLHVTFGTNPCRLSWICKEFLFFREDLLHKLRRNCIRPPSEIETTDISQHLVKTIVDQAHLCPLPMEKRPVYWNYDHALRLYPLPDVLVLADVVDQYEWPYEGVKAVNPGAFAHDFSFIVFYPAQNKTDFSRVK